MSIILIIVIATTSIISFLGFSNGAIFEKYKFSVSAIQQRKEYLRLLSS